MNLLCVCIQVFSCLCRFVCLVSKDVTFCESLSVTEVHWMSPKCLCVLIAGDRYHQSWHHWQMNGSAVFSSCPVSLSDSHSMQQQQQQKLLFFSTEFLPQGFTSYRSLAECDWLPGRENLFFTAMSTFQFHWRNLSLGLYFAVWLCTDLCLCSH